MLSRLEITSRHPVLDGKGFGAVGAYESLAGNAWFALDPHDPRNRRIVDLELAEADELGQVSFRADFHILKPVDPAQGNGSLLYNVVNRGRKGLLAVFNLAEGSNLPNAEGHFGDGFLMREGYTLAACGWQADVPPEAPDSPDLMTLDVPVARQPGGPVTGPVACEIVVDAPTTEHSLGSRYHRPYEPANFEEQDATLTVRQRPYDAPDTVARDRWTFDRLPDGRAAIRFAEGFKPGLIYNLVYTGKDPRVIGLGFAATRDFISFMKYASADESGDPNPVCGAGGVSSLSRAYAFGSSQSGRFLRHLVYEGFSQDETGRLVLDGVLANVAGGARGSFNHRFAQPSRHASGHTDVFYPTEQFPFTDASQTDPITGRTDGMLERCGSNPPKIFATNTSTEYWNRGASLSHTDVSAQEDVDIPDCVRIYHFSSTQHGPGALPSGPRNTFPPNPVNFRYALRALLVALDAWVKEGIEPPGSRFGRLADGTLVRPTRADTGFPKIPGLSVPRRPRLPLRLDHGDQWDRGVITREPPGLGDGFEIRVSAVDGDGNEIAGIRMPEVSAPLGTYTGWRLRPAETGAPDATVGLQGIWAPFARTEEERRNSGDDRQPIETRYADRDAYVGRVADAALHLLTERLILAQDVPAVLDRARKMYDWVMAHGG